MRYIRHLSGGIQDIKMCKLIAHFLSGIVEYLEKVCTKHIDKKGALFELTAVLISSQSEQKNVL